MIKLGIFDWNGTGINDLPLVYKSVIEMFKRNGLSPPTLEQYREEIKSDFMQFYRKYGIPETVSQDAINKIRAECLEKTWQEAKLMPGFTDSLRDLVKFNIFTALVSAEIPEVLSRNLERFGVSGLFDFVRGGAWPKEGALIESLKKFNVNPSEAFYVGDTADDMEVSKALGFVSIGFAGGYNSRKRIMEANPDFVINSLTEILPIVNSIK